MSHKKLVVHREAYAGHRHGKPYHVRASTFKVKDRGAPGRGEKVLPPLKKGDLGGKGFFSKPTKTRRAKESKLAKRYGEKRVVGKLRALQVLNKRQNPKVSKKAKADSHYIAGSFRGKKKVRYPEGFGHSKRKLRDMA